MKRRRPSSVTYPALLLALVVAALAGSVLPARADTTVRLAGDVVHHLDAATLVGPVDPSQSISVGVVLRNPNEAGEDAYLNSLYDPNSANYQNFLDSDQFNLQFGVPASTLTATQAWLTGVGLQVTTVPGATNYVVASGTASQLQTAFGTAINNYSAGGRTFYANAVAPAVPTSLPISTVVGLNNVNRFHTPRIQPPTGTPTTTTVNATGSTVPVTGLLAPQALWSIYDQPSTNRGNGQSMAIFGWGVTPDTIAHLRSFESEFGLPQVPVTISYFGATSTPRTSDGAETEWDLDTQASTAMAPDVQSETLYFAEHNTDADILAALTAWVNDKKGPTQGSASFGECENTAAEPVIGSDNLEAPGDAVLKQAVIEGRTLFASTGDTGSSCPIIPVNTNGVATQAYPALNYPAASPYVSAVGGTVLDSDGGNPPQRFAETAWTYTGGGNSTAITAPSYQADMVPTKCTTDDAGNPYLPGTAPPCRGIPDVAAISGDVATENGMTITDSDGADQQGAGTSLSSPLWLGMWTRVQAAAAKKGLGFANFSFYKIGKSAKYAHDFFDVTVGNNQPYPATPGWDNTTGWGTPDVAHLMQDLAGRVTPVKNLAAPVPAVAAPTTSCASLFSDAAGDDALVADGQTLGAQGAQPQLDILGGQMLLSPDGQTLRTIITIRNLTTDIPAPGTENTYNFVWFQNGIEFFTQLAVEPGGVVNAYDGEVLHLSLETRFEQLHVDKGTITLGPNGTVEVDAPLANIGAPTLGQTLERPSATSFVRLGIAAARSRPSTPAARTRTTCSRAADESSRRRRSGRSRPLRSSRSEATSRRTSCSRRASRCAAP